MNRREVLKNVALVLGGTLSSSTIMAMDNWQKITEIPASNNSFSLNTMQQQIVAEISELIIPKSHTPGDKDVGVPAFIEMMLKDCYREKDHQIFFEGITSLENINFLKMSNEEKKGVLKYMEYETLSKKPTDLTFWRLMKELTLLGYFTSEEGLKSSFEYVQIPGKLENIKLKPNQKAYAY